MELVFFLKRSKPINAYILKLIWLWDGDIIFSDYRRKKMVAYSDYIDIRKIGINRTGLSIGENCRYSLTINIVF